MQYFALKRILTISVSWIFFHQFDETSMVNCISNNNCKYVDQSSFLLQLLKDLPACFEDFYKLVDDACIYESPIFEDRIQCCKLPEYWTKCPTHNIGTSTKKLVENNDQFCYVEENLDVLSNTSFRGYDQNILYLNLSNNGIERVEPLTFSSFSNLTVLILKNNPIKDLEKDTFIGLDELDLLNLSYNQLTNFTTNVFANLKKLQYLRLNDNRISKIIDPFDDLASLKILDLKNNQIETLCGSAFKNLSKLEILYLTNNRLSTLGNDFLHNLPTLLELKLSHNVLANLSSNMFRNMNKLAFLYLSFNNISRMEMKGLSGLKSLKRLNLNNNTLENITSTMFDDLKKLKYLDLSSNRISRIENDSLNSLNNLEVLSLNNNALENITTTMFHNLKQLKYLDLSSNRISRTKNDSLNSLNNLEVLSLNNNALENITTTMFHNLKQLKSLDLLSNRISRTKNDSLNSLNNMEVLSLNNNALENITTTMFHNLKQLKSLDLLSNRISRTKNDSLNSLNNMEVLNVKSNNTTLPGTFLRHLDISYNNIATIETKFFKWLKLLVILNVAKNCLKTIKANSFRGLESVVNLNLSFNQIDTIEEYGFDGMFDLNELDLSNNRLTNLASNVFQSLKSSYNLQGLMFLHLQNNRITKLEFRIFEKFTYLIFLNLSNNAIVTLENSSFDNLTNLYYLYLQKNYIGDVDKNIFRNNTGLEELETDEFRFCCLLHKINPNIPDCTPRSDEFSSCKYLIDSNALRKSIWTLGIIVIVSNIYVFVIRLRSKNRINEVHSFLIKNLALSDSFMGIYLLIIAITNERYKQEYYLHDYRWRMSFLCHFAGFLSMFSSELTLITLTVITLDRLFAILFPFRMQSRVINTTRLLIAIGWLLAASISAIPLLFSRDDHFRNYYSKSGVCLPLHFNDVSNKWKRIYSSVVLIGFNVASFFIFVVSYMVMYYSVNKTRKAAETSEFSLKIGMAVRMAILILADATSRIPVIILGIRSFTANPVNRETYAWIAVFILPLTAALNPILYTITALPTFKRIRIRSPFYLKSKARKCTGSTNKGIQCTETSFNTNIISKEIQCSIGTFHETSINNEVQCSANNFEMFVVHRQVQ